MPLRGSAVTSRALRSKGRWKPAAAASEASVRGRTRQELSQSQVKPPE